MGIKYNNITFKQLQETWKDKLHSGKILELWKEFLLTLPTELSQKVNKSNYTLYNANEEIKSSLEIGQIPFVFEVPYEPNDVRDEFDKYAKDFIIVTNLKK